MKNLFIALVTISILLSGCISTKEQETKPEPTQPQNQQPAAETKVFHISPENVSRMMVATTLGPPRMTPFEPREATPEEAANIIKWYNSIIDYTIRDCCSEDIGPDAKVDIDLKQKVNRTSYIQIGLYGDRLVAWGSDGQKYWVEQPELKEYLKTVQ